VPLFARRRSRTSAAAEAGSSPSSRCAPENLIMRLIVMKSAEDAVLFNASGLLNRPRDRRIRIQGSTCATCCD
jgi:hypothetical protein